MQDQVQQNWGAGRNLAPTERRIDPLTYITSSLVMGALVLVLVLWLLWRPIPLLGLPRGSFSEHGLFAIKFLIHAALPPVRQQLCNLTVLVRGQPTVQDVGVDAVGQSHASHRGTALTALLRDLAFKLGTVKTSLRAIGGLFARNGVHDLHRAHYLLNSASPQDVLPGRLPRTRVFGGVSSSP